MNALHYHPAWCSFSLPPGHDHALGIRADRFGLPQAEVRMLAETFDSLLTPFQQAQKRQIILIVYAEANSLMAAEPAGHA